MRIARTTLVFASLAALAAVVAIIAFNSRAPIQPLVSSQTPTAAAPPPRVERPPTPPKPKPLELSALEQALVHCAEIA